MEAIRAGLESRRRSRSRFSTSANPLSRTKKQRPTISGPIGPVKNSRGPDLIRSEKFMIVPGIKDCSSEEDSSSLGAKEAARRISAGFPTHGPLAAIPTVAGSNVSVATTCQVSKTTKPYKELFKPSSKSRPSLKPSATFHLLSSVDSMFQDENMPPASSGPPMAQKPIQKTQLPKSRTMNVLSELKSSMSANARPMGSQPVGQESRKSSTSSTSTLLPSSSSRLRMPQASLKSLTRSSSSTSPEPQSPLDPRQISTAQKSAYWSGRFVALNDRFLAEGLGKEMPLPSDAPISQSTRKYSLTPDRLSALSRPTHLSYSTTTSALTTLTSSKPRPPPEVDEDSRYTRVFTHLDSLCTTSEARRSLQDWQQTYARRHNKPALLPKGGCMEDRSFMGRIFGAGVRKSERRSLPGPVPVPGPRAKPAAVGGRKASEAGLTARGRGKRLTMN